MKALISIGIVALFVVCPAAAGVVIVGLTIAAVIVVNEIAG